MTTLLPMRTAVYESYLESSILSYAKENIQSGRWQEEDALEQSRNEFHKLLPQGTDTPDQYLFEIIGRDNLSTVGFIWFAAVSDKGVRLAFVYDLEIKAPYRRQGYATQAFKAIETLVSDLGLASIGLHVFGHNTGALALYRQLGYEVTGINMLKKL
ncbi:GNAT family N-acetyltransferase [Iodobacter sp. HSC-16F04]|uniref:GNAT family N-acetyltransferase n=1 Tax=Iodobacter violaceini TaxID=3044271 RepID=A0ABX0KPY9_9NEIS|nr:GNAT family N-acetyltransferase [Iodobacter violacea]NHQ85674.1 GNAT family N-acetyltransferase [Iodobacter violacea]